MPDRDYRLRVASFGSTDTTTPDWTAGTLASHDLGIADPIPGVSAGMIRPLDGDVDAVSFPVRVIDEAEGMTSRLSDAGGRLTLRGRRVDWSVSGDGGSTWAVLFAGEIGNVTQEDPTVYRLSIVNQRQRESDITVFTADQLADGTFPFQVGTTTIYPHGIRADLAGVYKFAPHTPIGRWQVIETGPTVLRAVGTSGTAVTEADQKAVQVLTDDVVDHPKWGEANFEHARFREVTVSGSKPYAGTDHDLEGFGSTNSRTVGETNSPAGALQDDTQAVRQPIVVALGGVSVGDVIRGFIYAPTRPPDRLMPLHVGYDTTDSSFQIDPMQVVKDLYDFFNIGHDATTFSDWDASTNPTGLLNHPSIRGLADFRLRITRTWNLRELTTALYKMFGLVPLQKDGETAPRRVLLPSTDQLADPTSAFTLRAQASGSNEANVAGSMPSWQYGTETHVTRVVATWSQDVAAERLIGAGIGPNLDGRRPFIFSGVEAPDSLDRITTREKSETHDHDRVDSFGPKVHEVEMLGLHDKASAQAAIDGLSREVLDRFGDGAADMEVPAVETATDASGNTPADLDQGDYVQVVHEALPNPDTGDRAGTDLAQVLDVTRGFGVHRLYLLRAGPSQQNSATPTLSLAQETGNTDRGVTATISGLDASADSWALWLAVGDTQPVASSDKWYMAARPDASSSTVTVSGLPSGNTIWGRAQGWENQRPRSGFSNIDNVTLTGLPGPSSLTDDLVLGDFARLSFTPGDVSLHTEFRLDRGSGLEREAIQPPGIAVVFVSGLDLNTTYTAGVRHIDLGANPPGVSSEATATFTTTGTADNPDDDDPTGTGSPTQPGNPGVPKPPFQPNTPVFP